MSVLAGEPYRDAWARRALGGEVSAADLEVLELGRAEAGERPGRYPLPCLAAEQPEVPAEPAAEPAPRRRDRGAGEHRVRSARWSRWAEQPGRRHQPR